MYGVKWDIFFSIFSNKEKKSRYVQYPAFFYDYLPKTK